MTTSSVSTQDKRLSKSRRNTCLMYSTRSHTQRYKLSKENLAKTRGSYLKSIKILRMCLVLMCTKKESIEVVSDHWLASSVTALARLFRRRREIRIELCSSHENTNTIFTTEKAQDQQRINRAFQISSKTKCDSVKRIDVCRKTGSVLVRGSTL